MSNRRRPFFVVSIVLVSLLASVSDAATLVESSRSVLVSAFADLSGVATDDVADGIASDQAGAFLEAAVTGTGFGDTVVVTGEALQDSSITTSDGRIDLAGGGSAGGLFDVQDPGFPSRGNVTADTTLSIVFEVAEATAYVVAVSLSAELGQLDAFSTSASALGDVSAAARLTGVVTGLVFERGVADAVAGEGAVVDSFAQAGLLAADTYLLEIVARAELRGFEDAAGFASSGFGVEFSVVPEPSSALLVGLGLALLTRRGPSRRADAPKADR